MATATPTSYTDKVLVSDEVAKFSPEITELTRVEQTAQTCGAFAVLNRLTVAEIKLKRANLLSDSYGSEMKEIRADVHELTDSLLLGEDVRLNLDMIAERVTQLEQRVAA